MLDFTEYELGMEEAIEKLKHNFLKVRAGVANPEAFKHIPVYVYESYCPLNHAASISAPDALTIVIKPFDPSQLKHITESLLKFDQFLNPSDDGGVIHINIAPLTQEKRTILVKEAKSYIEQAKVNIRNIRRDMFTFIKNSKDISDNEKIICEEDAQKIVDKFNKTIEQIGKHKEAELTSI